MAFLSKLVQWPTKAGVIVLLAFLGLISAATIALAEPPAQGKAVSEKKKISFTLAQEIDLFEQYIYQFVGKAPKWPPNRRVHKRARAIAELSVPIARGYGIDPRVTMIIMRTESGFRESAVGNKDADDWGIMQINTRSWKRLVRDLDLTSTEGQIEAGHRVLELGYLRCNGSHKQAITYYSAGQCTVSSAHHKYRNIKHRVILLTRLIARHARAYQDPASL